MSPSHGLATRPGAQQAPGFDLENEAERLCALNYPIAHQDAHFRFAGLPLMNGHLDQVRFCDQVLSSGTYPSSIAPNQEYPQAMVPPMEAEPLEKYDSISPG